MSTQTQRRLFVSIRVADRDPIDVEMPGGRPIEALMPLLACALGQPLGADLRLCLPGGRRLGAKETLAAAGVRNFDVLALLPTSECNTANPLPAALLPWVVGQAVGEGCACPS